MLDRGKGISVVQLNLIPSILMVFSAILKSTADHCSPTSQDFSPKSVSSTWYKGRSSGIVIWPPERHIRRNNYPCHNDMGGSDEKGRVLGELKPKPPMTPLLSDTRSGDSGY